MARPTPLAAPAEQPARLSADDLPDSVVAELGMHQERHTLFRTVVVVLLLVLCVASVDLLYTRHADKADFPKDVADLEASLKARPAPPGPVSPDPRQLPPFIPQVAPDGGYPAKHPGWQRYQADGLEYLVYREKGNLSVVQVLSQQRGAITEPFLKTCIRISSGNDLFVPQKTELRSGIQVAAGTLQNGGELLVYRALPDGEIRGFVLTFPAGAQTPVQGSLK